MKSLLGALAIVSALKLGAWAQASGGSPAVAPAAPTASQGSATIENQMISYQAMVHIADQIAKDVRGHCNCTDVLLFDPNAQSEIITAKAFDVSADALIVAYKALAGTGKFSVTPTLDIGGFLTAIKSSATFSNQNFTPTAQSMITLLNISFNGNPAVHTTAAPGDLDSAIDDVKDKIGEIQKAREAAKAKVKPGDTALADLDKEFSALRTSLTAASPDGTVLATIVKGSALLGSLKDKWSVLTVSVDAAGGDTRIRHLFWQELVMPTPTPWYNGGATVSMLLIDKNGVFQYGHMYHYMYDFSKWKNKKLEPFPNDPN